jgi:glycosyltransferase involved in cell wall biosynthesis
VPQEKIAIVENGVETDLFSPQGSSVLRQELGADGKFVVCYIGTMGMAHGLETLVEAAARLHSAKPEILFLLVGEGADKERIQALARSRGLTNLRFVDQQPREKIPGYIRASDACLVLLRKTDLFKTVIPTKMLEFMSCARPVVLGVDGQARQILDAARAGIFVEPENASDLVQAIVRLATDAGLRDSLGRNGRRHILENFSRRQTAKTYIAVLDDLINGDRRRLAAA